MRAGRDASEHASSSESARPKRAHSLEAVENTAMELLGQVRRAREREDAQAKRMVQLEHENRALHLALQKLKEQRAKDRQVIEMWRQYTTQEAPTSDVSTQEGLQPLSAPQLPSSPPAKPRDDAPILPNLPGSSQPQNGHALSQRMLPMSIDVDELYEGEQAHPASQEMYSDERVASSSQSDIKSEIRMPVGLAKRFASEQPAESASEQLSLKRFKGARTESTPELSQVQDQHGVEDLLHRTWHPADFVLNPRPSEHRTSLISDAFISTVRSKSRQQCVHGKDCRNCRTVCDVFGYLGSNGTLRGRRQPDELSQQETPAGFWRTEFPESDDAQQDQVQAQAQWAAEGQKRLVEAVNEGRYLFKDRSLRERIRMLHASAQ